MQRKNSRPKEAHNSPDSLSRDQDNPGKILAKVSHTELIKQSPVTVSQEFNGHVLPARLVIKNTFHLSLTPKKTSNSTHLSGKFSGKKKQGGPPLLSFQLVGMEIIVPLTQNFNLNFVVFLCHHNFFIYQVMIVIWN